MLKRFHGMLQVGLESGHCQLQRLKKSDKIYILIYAYDEYDYMGPNVDLGSALSSILFYYLSTFVCQMLDRPLTQLHLRRRPAIEPNIIPSRTSCFFSPAAKLSCKNNSCSPMARRGRFISPQLKSQVSKKHNEKTLIFLTKTMYIQFHLGSFIYKQIIILLLCHFFLNRQTQYNIRVIRIYL